MQYFDRFNTFCNTFSITYFEQGYFSGDDWTYDNIMAPYNRLYIILKGQGIITHNEERIVLEEGFAYLIPAGVNFSCDSPIYLEKLYCHFLTDGQTMLDLFHDCDEILMLDLINPLSSNSSNKSSNNSNSNSRNNFTQYKTFHKALLDENIDMYYDIKNQYDTLIHRFIDLLASSEKSIESSDLSHIMQDLLILIEQNLHADLKTSWLAEKIGMTTTTLSKYYKKHMNRTLKKDLTNKLMQRGKIMLLTTEKNIQQIAYTLGYEDSLYFSKVFKKNEGMTPTAYRKKNQLYYR